jgi:hypothetical protein
MWPSLVRAGALEASSRWFESTHPDKQKGKVQMTIFKGKKKNWMIVLHRSFVGDRGWKHEILNNASKGEAEAYALVKAKEWKGNSIDCVSGTAIEL